MTTHRISSWLFALPAVWLSLASHAQSTATPIAQGQDVIALPAIGRVLFAFLLAAGLAVGAATVLRRVLPKFGSSLLSSSGSMKVLERTDVGQGLRLHLVQVDQQKVLVAASRNNLALVVLEDQAQERTQQS